MASSAHKRRQKHEEHEEHPNHERWLVSYADMLTVLVALFIVLFALSQIDVEKFAQFKAGLTEGGSASSLVMPGDDGINEVDNGADPIDLLPLAGGDPMETTSAEVTAAQTSAAAANLEEARQEVEDYRAIAEAIDSALRTTGDQDRVTYRITADGLVVGLVADDVLFANASAVVQPDGVDVLAAIAPVLAGLPNQIAIQGHTNSLPLNGSALYRNNWDLSSARATSVLMYLVDHGVGADRVSATGFGSARPLYPDDDSRALSGNRRVDVVIASTSSDAVKALLPQVAQNTPTDGPAEITGTTDTATAEVSQDDLAGIDFADELNVAGAGTDTSTEE